MSGTNPLLFHALEEVYDDHGSRPEFPGYSSKTDLCSCYRFSLLSEKRISESEHNFDCQQEQDHSLDAATDAELNLTVRENESVT